MLEFEGVAKSYGSLVALHPTELVVPDGETVVLIGPSGCGKSTLLRIALGLIVPDRGSVSVDGQRLRKSNLIEIRRAIGYVVQHGGLFPHLTAGENVALLAVNVGKPRKIVDERIATLLDLVQLPFELLTRYPFELSGGQQQRVGLMRALMLDPPLLLMDEPLGALDPLVRRDLQIDLREIFRRLGKTVLMVSHDLYEADYFADRIVLMNAGKIVQTGTLRELLESPVEAFVTRFIEAQKREFSSSTSSQG